MAWGEIVGWCSGTGRDEVTGREATDTAGSVAPEVDGVIAAASAMAKLARRMCRPIYGVTGNSSGRPYGVIRYRNEVGFQIAG